MCHSSVAHKKELRTLIFDVLLSICEYEADGCPPVFVCVSVIDQTNEGERDRDSLRMMVRVFLSFTLAAC